MRLLKIILAIVTIAALQLQNVSAQSNIGIDWETKILKILEDSNIPGAGVALVSKDSIMWMGTLDKRM